MLQALAQYLKANGFTNISLDQLPDAATQMEAIALLKTDHTVGEINDGTGTHLIRMMVRRVSYDEAYSVCAQLFALLDSGLEESLIDLTDEVFCIARPRKGPLMFEIGEGFATFYCETALWGIN